MHVAPDLPLNGHSIGECFLYSRLAWCRSCRRRRLRAADEIRPADDAPMRWCLPIACEACDTLDEFRFQVIPPGLPDSPVINPTAMASELIDMLGWFVLAQRYLELSKQPGDATLQRCLKTGALLCLAESAKFIGEGDESPPLSAFFQQWSRELFQLEPERFTRTDLHKLARGLPTLTDSTPDPSNSPWWKL